MGNNFIILTVCKYTTINILLILKFSSTSFRYTLLLTLLITLWSLNFLSAQETSPIPGQPPEKITVNHIFIIGNEKTKKNVILREMDLLIGATYDWDEFVTLLNGDQTKIYNLQLFTNATITPLFTDDDEVELLVSVKERWYVIPSLIFTLADRNFSEWWINQGRDLSRVNYGIKLNHNNVGGRNEKLRIQGQWGFTKAYELTYTKPYIDKEQQHGLSASIAYFTNKTIAIKSANNKQVFYTKDDEEVLRKTLNTNLTYTFRGSFYNFHYLSLGYNNTVIDDVVLDMNPNYFPHGTTRLSYFFAGYNYKHDRRDNVAYATDGELLNIGLNRYGLFTNDDVNETEIYLLANKYFPLNQNFHFVTGISASAYLSPLQPYTLIRGIGYSPDFIRGFEVNVIEGQQTIVHKNSLRYQLLNIVFDISEIMPLEEFSLFPLRVYLSANFDQGHVNDRNNLPENARLTNSYLYGYGLGLDLVTFYDQVFRFEYSVNSMGTGNFFINVRAPL